MSIKHDNYPFVADSEQIKFIQENAHVLTADNVADYLGIARRTLFKAFDRQPELKEAWQISRVKKFAQVGSALYQMAMEGNVTACIFLLKAQGKWTTTTDEKENSDDNPVRSIDDLYGERSNDN